MYEQATIAVQNVPVHTSVATAIQASFAPTAVDDFLRRVGRQKLRVRDFERILAAGLLGNGTEAAYRQLSDSDRGLIRELYLKSVEQVSPEMRGRHMKVYAYY
jgi:alpha-glucuronidase